MAKQKAAKRSVRIGVISDTHGHLHDTVLGVFEGVDHIIHAGDILDPATVTALAEIAPVTAVAGNLDEALSDTLPREVAVKVGGVRIVVGHKRKRLLDRLAARKIEGVSARRAPDLIVFGHEHVPSIGWIDGTLHLNPGTASSPYEEDDDPTVAVVEVMDGHMSVRFVPLPRTTPVSSP